MRNSSLPWIVGRAPVGARGATIGAENGGMRDRENLAAGDETMDTLFDGRIRIYQGRSGYRFSLDAVLLAHFVKIKARENIVDLGAGNGAIALMLATLYPATQLTGIELQAAMMRRARRSVAHNGLSHRIKIIQGDVRTVEGLTQPESFNVAVCNPPYRSPVSGRVSPNAEKRIARHEFTGSLVHFLRTGNRLLTNRGRLALVYPAYRCADLLTSMRTAGIEPKRLRFVHSFRACAASLMLAEGVKAGKSGITVEAPLIVYDEERRYSNEAAEMLAGEPHRK
jgi:tRNA1Val (adenine37-N6)-methyltransferase